MTKMSNSRRKNNEHASDASLAIIMLSLNEGHNMTGVLDNISDIADEIFLVDSFSSDDTVDKALERGVEVYQRTFRGFGDQWNWAITELPIQSAWTMKLDPDERLSDELKQNMRRAMVASGSNGFVVKRQLQFLDRPLPVRQAILRVWRTGTARFSDVLVNEHPIIEADAAILDGNLHHHDSPNLHHWYEKQNRYTTLEAKSAFEGAKLSVHSRLFGTNLERRMWMKVNFKRLPFRHTLMFLFCLVGQGAWRAGRIGWIWARLRSDVYRMIDCKTYEMHLHGTSYAPPPPPKGPPHPRAIQADQLNAGESA
ncbi:MAG: glycosyltransferase family 2 protein [Pseudomonadota bacterium]